MSVNDEIVKRLERMYDVRTRARDLIARGKGYLVDPEHEVSEEETEFHRSLDKVEVVEKVDDTPRLKWTTANVVMLIVVLALLVWMSNS